MSLNWRNFAPSIQGGHTVTKFLNSKLDAQLCQGFWPMLWGNDFGQCICKLKFRMTILHVKRTTLKLSMYGCQVDSMHTICRWKFCTVPRLDYSNGGLIILLENYRHSDFK